jgi:hypothetical protein
MKQAMGVTTLELHLIGHRARTDSMTGIIDGAGRRSAAWEAQT